MKTRVAGPPQAMQSTYLICGPSICFTAVGKLPTLEISAEDEELPSDLNDLNLLIFNDSAEMSDRKSSELRGVWNI